MNIGAVIGKFQVDALSEGHLFLINMALKNHRHVIVFLGIDPNTGTKANPLDYSTRERMIKAKFPDVTCLPLEDKRTDKVWSYQIDASLKKALPKVSSATIYSGKSSFISRYKGIYKVIEADSGLNYINAPQKRSDIGKVVFDSVEWRKGIIHATQQVKTSLKPAVLLVCVNREKGSIFLKKHVDDKKWSLPGGVLGSGHTSFEHAAKYFFNVWTSQHYDANKNLLTYHSSGKVKLWHFKTSDEIIPLAVLMRLECYENTLCTIENYKTEWFKFEELENVLEEDQLELYRQGNL